MVSTAQETQQTYNYNLFSRSYWFGSVDTRQLSAFRIVFALWLLKDAIYHLFIAAPFYSDSGVVPRDVLLEVARTNRFSIMDGIGASWLAQVFFGLWIVVLFCLLVGYRTRLMTILNFIILMSIHERNIYVINSADIAMRLLSFWMMFLPLGNYYSIDVVRWRWSRFMESRCLDDLRVDELPRLGFALPLRLIQLQVAMVYTTTFFHKVTKADWQQGEALHYALQARSLTTPFGDWFVLNMPPFTLTALTYFTLVMEATFLIFVFFPVLQPFLRSLALAMGAALHSGIAVMMSIPNFSFVMMISYLTFFPSSWVAALDNALRSRRRTLYLPYPPEGSPLWTLLAVTKNDEIALIDAVADSDGAVREGWVVFDEDEARYEGAAAWRQVAAHLPLSRLWRWSVGVPLVRVVLWQLARWGVDRRATMEDRCGTREPYCPPRWVEVGGRAAIAAMALPVIVLIAWWNASAIQVDGERVIPRPTGHLFAAVQYLSLWQGWDMFSPPTRMDGWITVEAVFEDGSEFDLLTGEPVDDEFTRWLVGPEMRWKKYISGLRRSQDVPLLSAWGSYYCHTYNTVGALPEGERLATFEIHYNYRRAYDPGGDPLAAEVERDMLWRHWCYEEYAY